MMSIFIRIGVLLTMFFSCFYPLQADEGEKPCGIINLSVATLCEKPDFSSEMMTQALLGMPVRVHKPCLACPCGCWSKATGTVYRRPTIMWRGYIGRVSV